MRFSRLQIGRNRKLDNIEGLKFFKIERTYLGNCKYATQIGRTFLTMGKITPCILKWLTYLY